MTKLLEAYKIEAPGFTLDVKIVSEENEFVKLYYLDIPEYGAGTKALMRSIKNTLISDVTIKTEKLMEPAFVEMLKKKFSEKASVLLQKQLPEVSESSRTAIVSILLEEMLGLGKIEFLLVDGNLEEVVVNSSQEPVWVYHKKYGWLKTNVMLEGEGEIQNFSNIIARRVGKQVTTLSPLLDAHLISGDRANATLFPISSRGNTITIRRFRRDPWTVTDFIENKTVNAEVAALLWMAIQYELNILFSGGTASGKTSMLNITMPFVQPNHRVLSLEDTRELQLPNYLHWVPLTTREPNPEGKGGISLLDLLVNSLRMRPDRIIVGEVRREREAEVMFEAMHTGHSVYTTVHANTADETIRRLVNPPINIPPSLLESVHLNVVMFRNRRTGHRRVLQLAEFIAEKRSEEREVVRANVLYRWLPSADTISRNADAVRLMDELGLHTGMNTGEIERDLKEKQKILEWMLKTNTRKVNEVGKVMAEYYSDKDSVMKFVQKEKKMEF